LPTVVAVELAHAVAAHAARHHWNVIDVRLVCHRRHGRFHVALHLGSHMPLQRLQQRRVCRRQFVHKTLTISALCRMCSSS